MRRSMQRLQILAAKFKKAPQVLVTQPTDYAAKHGWLSAKSYPSCFVAEQDEVGMVIENGEITYRVFHPQ
jgi:hypothetical protein